MADRNLGASFVFNQAMLKRFSLPHALIWVAPAALLATALTLPTAASAAVVQVGQTKTPLTAPACPKGTSTSSCKIVLERTTAIQTKSDGVAKPTVVKQDGWIVAFTVGLSRLSSNAKTVHSLLHGLDSAYGGTPQLSLSVLKPGANGAYTVRAQSGSYHLIPFLGQVLTEPMSLPPKFTAFTALRVEKGDVLALTVPTWAPILTYNLSASQFSYAQSRTTNCDAAAASQTAQTRVGSSQKYGCAYTGTRVQYSATEVTNVPYPKHYPH
jgi:hypothetical protein